MAEKIICADPVLRRADATLGRLYQELLHLPDRDPAYVQALRADERAWIIERDRECGVRKYTEVTRANRRISVDCFLDAYDERMADLGRMRADATLAPGDVSTPIRVMRKTTGAKADPALAAHAVETALAPLDGATGALMDWYDGGRLVALGNRPGGKAGLFTIDARGGVALESRGDVDAPGRSVGCVSGAGALLATQPQPESNPGFWRVWTVTLGADWRGAEARQTNVGAPLIGCAFAAEPQLAGRRVVGDRRGEVLLDLGPTAGPSSEDRRDTTNLVLRNRATAIDTPLPIRVSSLFDWRAEWSDVDEAFLIYPGLGPRTRVAPAEVRRRAKYDCVGYWRVDRAGAATRLCLPFGAYGRAEVKPLASGRHTLFTVLGPEESAIDGLYRLDGGQPVKLLDGRFGLARLSADGCRVALIPRSERRGRIILFEVCAAEG